MIWNRRNVFICQTYFVLHKFYTFPNGDWFKDVLFLLKHYRVVNNLSKERIILGIWINVQKELDFFCEILIVYKPLLQLFKFLNDM